VLGRFLVIFKVARDHRVPAVVTKLKPCVPCVDRWFSNFIPVLVSFHFVQEIPFLNFFSGIVERYYSGLLHSSYCSYNYHLYIHGCKKISGTVTLTLSRAEHLFTANFVDF
jgi:hypothetical protein